MGDVVTAMRVGQEALGAFGRPLHRAAAHELGRPGADHLFGVDEDLGAEAAAHVRRNHAQLVLGRQAVEGRDHQAGHMRVLAGGVERVVLGTRVVVANGRARLHGVGDQPVVDQVDLGDVRGLLEGGVRRGFIADRPVEHPVVGRHLVDLRLVAHGVGHVHHMRQHAVIDVNRRGGGLGKVTRLGNDDGHVVAHVAHLAKGEDRMRARLHRRAVLGVDHPAADQAAQLGGRHVVAGEDADDARHLLGLGRVDLIDGGMRVGAAHEVSVGLLGQVDVVGVVALAGEEAMVFLALHAGADAGSVIHVFGPPQNYMFAAPALTAATMLW